MPKKQSTAAKRARAAARQGEKYTTVLRAELAATDSAPDDSRDLVVAALTDLLRSTGGFPVRVLPPANPVPRPKFADDRRWGIVEAAVDGFLIRMTNEWHVPHSLPGPGRQRRPRVPVPYLAAGGRVEVLDLPPVVWAGGKSCGRWVYAHNGWAVDTPGEPADCDSSLVPSFDLPYEVMEFYYGGQGLHEVLGEDYIGSPAYWSTTAWCATAERARELADALVAWEDGAQRVQVWEHNRGALNVMPELIYQHDAAADRPRVPRRPWGAPVTGRPADPDPALTEEPAWLSHIGKPGKSAPNYALHVWTATDGWDTIGWFEGGRTPVAVAAAQLRVGVDGGPYPFGYVSGPNYPRSWDHDWTQEGRCCADHVPDLTNEEWDERLAVRRPSNA